VDDLVPDGTRIDRGAIERIIRRAAELQASGRDLGDGLTEAELHQLGREVGIPAQYLQQALMEERTRSIVAEAPGFIAWLTGARFVVAQRTIDGEPGRIREALHVWMTDGELLTVKRRYPDHTSWEQRRDVFSSLKRGFKIGGRDYVLATAKEVIGQVSRVDDARAHLYLVADMSNTRRSHLGGGITMTGIGGGVTLIGLTLSVAVPVAVIPAAVGGIAGFAIARHRRTELERVQVALEQVIDRIEHGEIKVPPKLTGPRPSAFSRIADEIRKNLGA
jgi:hypothetical protein